MSAAICEAIPAKNETTTQASLQEACRAIRQNWTPEERARRQKLAEVKQLGLLLNTVDFTTVLQAIVSR